MSNPKPHSKSAWFVFAKNSVMPELKVKGSVPSEEKATNYCRVSKLSEAKKYIGFVVHVGFSRE
jgi:hypothetical protein